MRGQKLGRRILSQVAGIVTPDTILRWYRRLIAQQYDGSARRRRALPMTPRAVAELVVRMADENTTWGYTRVRGALANLGHHIARNTVKRILHDQGIAPAPERNQRTPWKTFLQAHWEGLAAADLFTVEVLTLAGLRRYFVFFVIALKTRRVHIAGIHPQPDGRWMEQMARNLTDPVDGFLRTARQLIHDCGPLYTRVFGEIESSRSARGICGSSFTSTSSIISVRETTRDSTTSSCNDRRLRYARTPMCSGVSASADCSVSTIERPHEGSAH